MFNLLIDGVVLAATAWVRGIRIQRLRLLAAAALGASYVLFLFAPALSFLYTIGVKFMLSLFMLWLAFGFVSLQYFVRNVGAFYGVNFAAAGGIIGLYYMLQSTPELWRAAGFLRTGGQGSGMQAGIAFVMLAFVATLLLGRSVLNSRKRTQQLAGHLADVAVAIGEKEVRCKGLIDTGNQLVDPLTRTPVMVMEAVLWQEQLPAHWLRGIRESRVEALITGLNGDEQDGQDSKGGQQLPDGWADRIRLVPYRGINRGTQFMLALKPDQVQIEQGGSTITSRRVLIGLDGGRLAADGSYQAVIHPALATYVTDGAKE